MRRPTVRQALAICLICGVGMSVGAGGADLLSSLPGSQRARVTWQIGQFDGSAREFALAPSAANDFAKRFGPQVTFDVATMTAADFPFIQPSAKDTLWGGREIVPFTIGFDVSDTSPTYAVVIALVDTHEQFASTMEISVNGSKAWAQRMPLGRGRAYYGEVEGRGPVFLVPLPAASLRAGRNELTIALIGGSWVAYDALALVALELPAIEAPAAAPLAKSQVGIPVSALETSSAILLPADQAAYVAALGNGWVRSPEAPAAFHAEFDLRIIAGDVALALELPPGARDLAWAVGFATAADGLSIGARKTGLSNVVSDPHARLQNGWVHCVIEDTGKAVTVTVGQDGRRATARLDRIPAPPGRLKWIASDAGAQFAIANLRWEPLAAAESRVAHPRPRRAPARKAEAKVTFDKSTGRMTIGNSALEVVIETAGRLNPRSLRAVGSGAQFADGDYVYAFDDGKPQARARQEIDEQPGVAKEVRLISRLGDLEIEHRFTVFAAEPAIEEQIIIRNKGSVPLDTSRFACGFTKRITGSEAGTPEVGGARLIAIPYRREPETGEFCDYALTDLAWQSGWFFNASRQPKVMTPAFGSEGWAWVTGDETLAIIKYKPDAMEWSLIEPVSGEGGTALRFGGAGIWKRGDPEGAARLAPGAEFAFGITRYELCSGGWQSAFEAFRRFMDGKGHATPRDYDPPVHWNELYDNPLWWGQDTLERRAEFYRRQDMDIEGTKAAELGCEALYLDPGWDTSFASSIWAADRLGPEDDFVRDLREKFGLKLALHTPLAGWSDVNAYPVEARRKDRDGNRLDALCSAAPAYLDTKAQRLIELCDKGAAFLMFDGSGYTGECWDPAHGHSLPLTRQEHCMAYRELTRRVKERHPEVLIELHDPIVAGVNVRYAPTYFLHGGPRGFDELWGYEYMWDPMDDIYSGRALSLYYANLAYSIPIYLHIDLRRDNENALEFWWYASTCRHLGVGGRHPDDRVWNAHKRAMQTYRRLKRFYTQGGFYGLDETVHAHTLADEGRCVLNIFNLADVEVERDIGFKLGDVGLTSGRVVAVDGAAWNADDDEVRLTLKIPARGQRLVELTAR
jgi:hypothetical protein